MYISCINAAACEIDGLILGYFLPKEFSCNLIHEAIDKNTGNQMV